MAHLPRSIRGTAILAKHPCRDGRIATSHFAGGNARQARNLGGVSRGRPWSAEYLTAMVAAWSLVPKTASAKFVAVNAPGLPARTLRHHRHQLEEEQNRIEVQQLRSELVRLQAQLDEIGVAPNASTPASPVRHRQTSGISLPVSTGPPAISTPAPALPSITAVTGPPAASSVEPSRRVGLPPASQATAAPAPDKTKITCDGRPVQFSWDEDDVAGAAEPG